MIELYISNRKIDLDNQSLVQMNYTAEELSNPTIVKNSYSRQVAIKGTPNNNNVFGGLFELSRRTVVSSSSQSGVNFNPMQKAPFIMFRNGEIIERGYIRLDQIERKGESVSYKITLFGGLGEFFYSLSFFENGDKKNLASLQYTTKRSSDNELDFTISASAISQAWSAMQSGVTSGLWSVINFAPAYNGIPSDSLSPDKAIIRASDAGLQTSVTEDGKTYGTVNGWALVQLNKEYTEWQTKDFRSYLQRPVISIRKIIEACCNPSNNGGFSVELDPAFFNESNPYWSKTWLSMPLLNTLEIAATGGKTALSWDEENYGDTSVTVYADRSLQGTTASLSVSVKPKILCWATNKKVYLSNTDYSSNFVRIRLRARGISISDEQTTPWVSFGHAGSTDSGTSQTIRGAFDVDDDGDGFWDGDAATLTLEDVASATGIYLDIYEVWNVGNMLLYTESGDTVYLDGYGAENAGSEAMYESFLNARSGTRVTKQMLLSTSHTPADYLVGYCKMFGLQLLYDKTASSVKILTRNTFYNGEEINLTDRIDHGQPMTIKPFVFDAKWYSFSVDSEGEFASYYKKIYGRDYGLQRVNTGYSFDANEKNLLDGVAFKGAVEVSELSKYNLNISRNGAVVSAVSLDTGHTYSLFDSSGDSTEIDFPTSRKSDVIEYWDSIYKGYDFASRVQFHGADDSAEDGADVLLFYQGFSSNGILSQFQLSDDLSVMGQLNDGEPCWMLNGGDAVNGIPLFGRYIQAGGNITYSLDFGTPVELDIPNVTVADGSTIYDKAWMAYIADRYDLDTKVVTCKVNLSGIRVDAGLLRNFYYFGQSWWVMNAIKNYDATKDNPIVECEFVKVKNKDNYTKGQLWQ